MPTNEPEIIQALNALSPEDKKRLHKFAGFKMLGIRGRVYDADAEDLLNEAIARTLDGRRVWNSEKIDFPMHIMGCIRSIADELASKSHRVSDASDQHDSGRAQAEIESQLTIEILRSRFAADVTALRVFDSIIIGEKPAEALRNLDMSADVYTAARKRILRSGIRLLGGNNE
jgi:hypothetical protein